MRLFTSLRGPAFFFLGQYICLGYPSENKKSIVYLKMQNTSIYIILLYSSLNNCFHIFGFLWKLCQNVLIISWWKWGDSLSITLPCTSHLIQIISFHIMAHKCCLATSFKKYMLFPSFILQVLRVIKSLRTSRHGAQMCIQKLAGREAWNCLRSRKHKAADSPQASNLVKSIAKCLFYSG